MSGNGIVQAIDCVERTLIIFVCYSFSKYQNICPQKYDNVYYKWKEIYLHLEYKMYSIIINIKTAASTSGSCSRKI